MDALPACSLPSAATTTNPWTSGAPSCCSGGCSRPRKRPLSQSEKRKKPPPEPKVSWFSLHLGILLLLTLIALVGWAAWYLPRDLSTSVNYELTDTLGK